MSKLERPHALVRTYHACDQPVDEATVVGESGFDMDPVTIEDHSGVQRLSAPAGISHHGQHVIAGEPWLVVNAYQAPHGYETTYVQLARTPRQVVEDQGVLPVLFSGLDDVPSAVVTNPYGDRDREVVRTIGGAVGNPFAPFVGTPLWRDGDVLVLGLGARRPNTWLRYDLRRGTRRFVTLEAQGVTHFVRNDEGLHALAGARHSLLSADGKVVRERVLGLEGFSLQPVELRFDGVSTFFASKAFETLWWVQVTADGTVSRTQLAQGSFFSLFPVERLADGAVALRTVGERGNGWFLVRDGAVVQSVTSTPRGYVDANGVQLITLPEGQWILSGLSALGRELVVTVYSLARVPDALWVARLRVS